MGLKIKVCGMREPGNISGVGAANPDYMGFIFYPKSKRFVGFGALQEVLAAIPASVKKVGVFVNEPVQNILSVSENWNLEAVQLHGDESPEVCKELKDHGLIILKAFSVDESFDFDQLEAYIENCDYFLFDTKSQLRGGSGLKFNWQLLESYQLEKPFFLSGGIGPGDLSVIKKLSHPKLFGIDLNSGFEISPALKDIDQVGTFIRGIRQ